MTEDIAFPQRLKTILKDENKHLKKLPISQKKKKKMDIMPHVYLLTQTYTQESPL